MMSRRRVSSSSGTSANGMPNDSTTWLSTSASVGFDADREHDERGQHRDEAPQDHRDRPGDEALHDDLTG